jgi:hypothetical protein
MMKTKLLARAIILAIFVQSALVFADGEIRDTAFFLKRLRTVEHLPELENSHTAMSSTWDRSGGNADGADYKRIENGSNILLDVNGPGCVHRIFTGILDTSVADTRIQIFLDRSKEPIFDMPVAQFFNDVSGPLPYPLVFHKSYPGILFPIPFEKHIYVRLVNKRFGAPDWKDEMWGNFWQLTYTQYAPEIKVKSLNWPLNTDEKRQLQITCDKWLQTESSPPAEPSKWKVDKTFSLDPNQVKTVDLSGCGIIRRIRLSPMSEAMRGLRIRIYWDGSANPSVDVPVEYFFGIANREYGQQIESPFVVMGRDFLNKPETYTPHFNSLLLGVTPAQMYCLFPMPFDRGAILQFDNKGKERIEKLNVRLDVENRLSLSPQLGRFHATWTQEPAATESTPKFGLKNVPAKIVLDRKCKGKYVGVLLSLDWPSNEWWGEGDWLIWSDENDWPPSYHGTGSEEYFNSGWCRFDRKAISGFVTVRPGHPTVYSFHLNDAFQFSRRIRVAEEQMGLGNGDVYLHENHPLWRSTAFWYASPAQPAESD